MKKLKLYLINFLLTTLLLIFNTSLISRINYHKFDTNEVINRIKYLSSDELEGRLCGSLGNTLAQNFIVNNFKNSNLLPYNFNYLHSFNAHYPKEIDGEPTLNIIDTNGNIIKTYVYNRDFKDSFLNFRINNISFNKDTSINIHQSAFLVKNNTGNSAIFIASDMSSFNFRSSFIYDTPCDLYAMLSPNTFNEIIEYYNSGYTIECFFPYEVKETTVNNVAAIIKGRNPFLSPLVLTAHYDHVGKDLDGNVFPGALDNASGVSFLMELSDTLSSLPMPDRDIIIVALNAEEFGLLGAEAFAHDNIKRLKNGKVINFDMIGSDNGIPLTLMTGENRENKNQLLENLDRYCKTSEIAHIISAKDASDHVPFLNNGIDAVTINDGDTSKIHTPKDTVKYISTTAIDRAFSIVWKEIYNSAYKYSGVFMLDSKVLFLTFLMCVIVSFTAYKYKNE